MILRKTLMLLGIFVVGLSVTGASHAQYCVRTVKSMSDFEVRGDAWEWWGNSAGQYARGGMPAMGSVLVFQRSGSMPLGHVSLVTGLVDDRTILVDHTFGGPRIWRSIRVIDVSPNNDWSAVRVWSGRANVLGSTVFPIYGFIYPEGPQSVPIQTARVAAAGGPQSAINWDVLASVPTPDRPPARRDGPQVAALGAPVETVVIPRR